MDLHCAPVFKGPKAKEIYERIINTKPKITKEQREERKKLFLEKLKSSEKVNLKEEQTNVK